MDAPATIAGVKSWKMGFALLGGAVAWGAHLLLGYAIAEFACIARLGQQDVLGFTIISWVLLGISVVLTAIAAAALLISKRIHDRTHLGGPALAPTFAPAPDPDDSATREFVGRFGLIANGLFVFIIIVESVPIFFYWGRC